MLFPKTINLLLIEDEEYDAKRVQRTLEPFEDRIRIKAMAADGQTALEHLQNDRDGFDVVIMDYQIVGGISGEKLIREIKNIDRFLQIIVITKMTINVGDFEFANRLIEAGAMWYCTKYPGDIEDYIYQPTDFILSIFNAYEKKKLAKEQYLSERKLKRTIDDLLEEKRIIGESPAMENLRSQIEKLSRQEPTVLIYGNSGTGKELVANHLHYSSNRRTEKFVAINCGSLPSELIESELFGFEKGAFTGASTHKKGLFEIAHKGTLFLDEVAELPASAQAKLLRVLQEGEIDKIGRTEKVQVDVRIIAATNKNLLEAVQDKMFREDLYYRLNVVTLRVPDLVERRDDIPELVDYFLDRMCEKMKLDKPNVDKKALQALKDFDWPGNVRQLQNVLQRILVLSDGDISAADVQNALGNTMRRRGKGLWRFELDEVKEWRKLEREMRAEYFSFVRSKSNSDAEAAQTLGLAPPNFYRMCKELGLK